MAAQDMLMQSRKKVRRAGAMAALAGLVFVVPSALAWLTLFTYGHFFGDGPGRLNGQAWVITAVAAAALMVWGMWVLAVTYLGRAAAVVKQGQILCQWYGGRAQSMANKWLCTVLTGCPDVSRQDVLSDACQGVQQAVHRVHWSATPVLPPRQPDPPAVELAEPAQNAGPVWSTGDVGAHSLFVTSCPPGPAAKEAVRLVEGTTPDGPACQGRT